MFLVTLCCVGGISCTKPPGPYAFITPALTASAVAVYQQYKLLSFPVLCVTYSTKTAQSVAKTKALSTRKPRYTLLLRGPRLVLVRLGRRWLSWGSSAGAPVWGKTRYSLWLRFAVCIILALWIAHEKSSNQAGRVDFGAMIYHLCLTFCGGRDIICSSSRKKEAC